MQELCDDIIARVCEPVEFEGGEAQVGASIGAAWWPDDANTGKMVIRSAELCPLESCPLLCLYIYLSLSLSLPYTI